MSVSYYDLPLYHPYLANMWWFISFMLSPWHCVFIFTFKILHYYVKIIYCISGLYSDHYSPERLVKWCDRLLCGLSGGVSQ